VEVYACARSRVDSKWSNGALIRVAPCRKVGLRPQRRPATRSIRRTGSVLDGMARISFSDALRSQPRCCARDRARVPAQQ